ncbi:MAG: hypothetical protein WC719_00020 [Patescibacteria group bacterium]|jgi:hypothetical protein
MKKFLKYEEWIKNSEKAKEINSLMVSMFVSMSNGLPKDDNLKNLDKMIKNLFKLRVNWAKMFYKVFPKEERADIFIGPKEDRE